MVAMPVAQLYDLHIAKFCLESSGIQLKRSFLWPSVEQNRMAFVILDSSDEEREPVSTTADAVHTALLDGAATGPRLDGLSRHGNVSQPTALGDGVRGAW